MATREAICRRSPFIEPEIRTVPIGTAAGTCDVSGISLDNNLPFSATDVTLWVKSGLSVTLSGGKFVSWGDNSGVGNDFLQPTDDLRPTAILVDGINAPNCDGANDYLESNPASVFIAAAKNEFDAWLVVEPDTIAAGVGISYLGSSIFGDAGGYVGVYGSTYAGTAYAQAFAWDGAEKTTAINSNSSISTGGTRVLLQMRMAAGTLSMRVADKTALTVASGPIQIVTGAMRIGKVSTPFDGRVLEIIMCSSAQTAGNVTNIRNYLAGQHGITV